jgi:FkbM family methyltransferase
MIRLIKALKNKLFNSSFRSRPSQSNALVDCQFLGSTIHFAVSNSIERWRVDTLFTKEPQTVQWIQDYVKEGDIFYDIGANIGIYSLLAAIKVGKSGSIYAFEPHAFSFTKLLNNISINSLDEVVLPLSCALGNRVERLSFNYKSLDPGSSDSQLGTYMDMNENIFVPMCTEVKISETVDTLVEGHGLKPPTHIKIDVDGNELLILKGMRNTLINFKPKSVQVEINQRYKVDLFEFMQSCGYKEIIKGYTMYGQQQLSAGEDPSSIAYNALFVPL